MDKGLTKKDEIAYTLRIPADLHKRLKFIAVDRDMSLNKLIVYVLRQEAQEAHVRIPNIE